MKKGVINPLFLFYNYTLPTFVFFELINPNTQHLNFIRGVLEDGENYIFTFVVYDVQISVLTQNFFFLDEVFAYFTILNVIQTHDTRCGINSQNHITTRTRKFSFQIVVQSVHSVVLRVVGKSVKSIHLVRY